MSSMNVTNVKLPTALVEKIKALPAPCYEDAYHAAVARDLCGLAFIANMAEGRSGGDSRNWGEMMDLADFLRGSGVQTVEGIARRAA